MTQKQFDKVKKLLTEFKAIDECSPDTPWSGCTKQDYDNTDHFDGHIDSKRLVMNELYKLFGVV